MKRALSVACLSVLLCTIGCGDSSETPAGGADAGGAPAEGGGGADGGAGGAPGCPAGSHDDGSGACVAELGAFTEAPSISDARDHHATWASSRSGGTFLYVAGGYADQVTAVNTIERAPIAGDGTLGDWQTLPTAADVSGAVVVESDGVVVLAGGYRGASPSKAVDIITIDDEGNISDPVDGPYLHDARFHGAGVLVDGWVYAVGGLDSGGSSLPSVERAKLDGASLGEWMTDAPMSDERSHFGLATDGRTLYVTGGLKRVHNDFANDIGYDTVLSAKIGAGGGLEAWQDAGTLPRALSVHSSFVHAGMLYVVGGLDNVALTFQKNIYRAGIAESGELGEWQQLDVSLPQPRGHTLQTPVVEGTMYSVGGEGFMGSVDKAFFARFQ